MKSRGRGGQRNTHYPADFGPTSFQPTRNKLSNFAYSDVHLGSDVTNGHTATQDCYSSEGLARPLGDLAGCPSAGADASLNTPAEMKTQLTKTSLKLGNDQRFM